MIEYAVICIVAIVVSALTLFSGFGLGTLLMPAFALFFPINVAVAVTAVVHLVNNLFKVVLVGKHANIKVVIRFAVPAAIFAALGAFVLSYIAEIEPLARYDVGGRSFEITTVKLVVAALIAIFSLLDLLPRFQDLAFDEKYIPLGGILSGFFGGLSGLQGALRSAFLIRAGLDKDQFIGTGVVSAVVVDVSTTRDLRGHIFLETLHHPGGTRRERSHRGGYSVRLVGIVHRGEITSEDYHQDLAGDRRGHVVGFVGSPGDRGHINRVESLEGSPTRSGSPQFHKNPKNEHGLGIYDNPADFHRRRISHDSYEVQARDRSLLFPGLSRIP